MKTNVKATHIKRLLLSILAKAQRAGATELIIAPGADGGTGYRYYMDDTWHESEPSRGLDWPLGVSELAGLAGIRNGSYPKQGILCAAYSGVRLRWHVKMTGQGQECFLHNLGSEMI